jgi:hypothetical protein
LSREKSGKIRKYSEMRGRAKVEFLTIASPAVAVLHYSGPRRSFSFVVLTNLPGVDILTNK